MDSHNLNSTIFFQIGQIEVKREKKRKEKKRKEKEKEKKRKRNVEINEMKKTLLK
jgi:hypothetical protein